MSSELLGYIGIGQIDPAYIIIAQIVINLIFIIILMVFGSKLKKVKKTYEKFMRGKNAKSMENEIIGIFEDINFLKISDEKSSSDIKSIKENLTKAYQKVGIVKYDAFREMGGKLSFSIALLNDMNTGFIINSVHSSEGCYTYTKEIVGGEAFLTLGEEEKEALDKAMNCNMASAK